MTNTDAKIMREAGPVGIWHPSRFDVLYDFDGSYALIGEHGFDIVTGFPTEETAWEWLAAQDPTS